MLGFLPLGFLCLAAAVSWDLITATAQTPDGVRLNPRWSIPLVTHLDLINLVVSKCLLLMNDDMLKKSLNCIKIIDILKNKLQFVNLLIELGIPLALTRAVLQDMTCPTVPEPGWKHTAVPSDLLIRFRLWSNFQCLFSQLVLRFTLPIFLDNDIYICTYLRCMICDILHIYNRCRCFFRTEIVFKETNWSSVTLWRNWVCQLDIRVSNLWSEKMVCFFSIGWNIMGCRTLQVRICFNNFCNTFCLANYDSLFEILDIWWWMFICERFKKHNEIAHCCRLIWVSKTWPIMDWLTGFDGYQF